MRCEWSACFDLGLLQALMGESRKQSNGPEVPRVGDVVHDQHPDQHNDAVRQPDASECEHLPARSGDAVLGAEWSSFYRSGESFL